MLRWFAYYRRAVKTRIHILGMIREGLVCDGEPVKAKRLAWIRAWSVFGVR